MKGTRFGCSERQPSDVLKKTESGSRKLMEVSSGFGRVEVINDMTRAGSGEQWRAHVKEDKKTKMVGATLEHIKEGNRKGKKSF